MNDRFKKLTAENIPMFQITRRKLNIAFWVFFILSAAVLIAGLITNAIQAAILLSLLVITAGFHGLLEEFTAKENRRAFRKIDGSLQQLSDWIQRTYLFAMNIKEKHDIRFHNLDTKRSRLEQAVEKRNRELTKQIIDMENKFNSLKKHLASERPKPLTTFERRVGRLVTILRKEGIITPAIYSQRIGVSRAVAREDLKKIAGMRIIRKRGKGRNVYYILAV